MIERLRLGCWVMIREGAIRKELEGVKGVFDQRIDFRRLILATDGMDPQGFLEEGYLDAALKRGTEDRNSTRDRLPDGDAQCGRTLPRRSSRRVAFPGKMADLVVIPSPENYSPQLVMCKGEIIFKNGENRADPKKVSFPDEMFHTVHIQDQPIPSIPSSGIVRVMELVSRLVTRENVLDLEDQETAKDLIPILAVDRLGGKASFMELQKGFGLQRGACGSTMTWDTTDMLVAGCDAVSMRTVIGRLREMGGGAVYAIGEEVIAEFPAPLCGVISLKPMETMREEMAQIETALRKNGVTWERPVLTLDTLGSPTIPHLRITHRGYVRLKDREILPLEVP